ncbi:hypothetical protein BX661DRAFT_178640 [Kickxella alabastrina]|uniref:uncharacterized protein n=1 Tax=Kickxella alabastrina TaxID=61397 RepID=UPI00221E7322|nr:uncharacterized protein BX661DRAFT_178640 [Kickxella alabastrina]KAI7833573.1 hypothetical protein BX661DRAFT_178640 [Kickxella alabastrina]
MESKVELGLASSYICILSLLCTSPIVHSVGKNWFFCRQTGVLACQGYDLRICMFKHMHYGNKVYIRVSLLCPLI